MSQGTVLELIEKRKGEWVNITELSLKLPITRNNVARAVNKLYSEGLLLRRNRFFAQNCTVGWEYKLKD